MACCAFCEFSRFFRNDKSKTGTANSRAGRALAAHVRTKHPGKGIQFWVPNTHREQV